MKESILSLAALLTLACHESSKHSAFTTENLGLRGSDIDLVDEILVRQFDEGLELQDLNRDGDLSDEHLYVSDLSAHRESILFDVFDDFAFDGRYVSFKRAEFLDLADLNGDGDSSDRVLFVHDTETGTTTNLGWAVEDTRHGSWSKAVMAFKVNEESQGTDLDGDGELDCSFIYAYEADLIDCFSSIMGPQTRILFSLSGSLQPNSTQQFVQIINDPLV